MTSIFIVPAADPTARKNLELTVVRDVPPSRLTGLSKSAIAVARRSSRSIFAWGTKQGKDGANVSTWERMEPGDWVLFYSNRGFPYAGRVLLREQSRNTAIDLWGTDGDGETWEYLYLIDERKRLDVPRRTVTDAFGYEPTFYPRRFQRVDRAFEGAFVERTLIDLKSTGTQVDAAIAMLRGDDPTAAVIGADRLGELLPDKAALEEVIRSRTSSEPKREQVALQKRIKRDQTLATSLKALYGGRCQRCDFTFLKADGTPYSEAAHLRPLHLQEADLDVKDNILVMCPNHHKMLDYGAMVVEFDPDADALLCHQDGKTITLENKHIGPGRPGKAKGKGS